MPAFSWALSVSDSSFSTTRDKGTGEGEASSITLPWTAVPGDDAAARGSELASARRGIVLFWTNEGDDWPGVPVIWGAIGTRSDSLSDTTFSLDSPLTILAGRYCVREGAFGAFGGTSRDVVSFQGQSYRSIAAQVGELCCGSKPGGQLPIDWQYAGEKGGHDRTYQAFDIQNLSCRDILTKLANVSGGPDMQFRPYVRDRQHVCLRFLAGSDADVYLGQDTVRRLSCFPGGGSIEDVTVDHLGPVSRVYVNGAGTDQQQLCALAEDLTLQRVQDPWPITETTLSDTDTDNLGLLREHAKAQLEAGARPLMQLSGYVDASDADAPSPGHLWPGEVVELSIDGFPTLPDGIYRLRLMEMSGDEGSRIKLKFDACPDPIF